MDRKKALEFAKKMHSGQKRIGGQDYIEHPIMVAKHLEEKGYKDKEIITAYFHDLLEDTKATKEEIIAYSSEEVYEAVVALTKLPDYEIHTYIDTIRQNPLAHIVKIADRLHNLESIFSTGLDFKKKYYKETREHYLMLAKNSVFEQEMQEAFYKLEKSVYYDKKDFLELLSRSFPTALEASTEIINLEAILNLPKGTELFLSDLHGEDEAFSHILKSGSGIIKKKIEDVFASTLTSIEKRKLAILIYYPKEVLLRRREEGIAEEEKNDWFEVTLHRLVSVCREVSSKYTRSKVRKSLPSDFTYIIEELLHNRMNDPDKNNYYNKIIKTIIDIGISENFIIAISEVIQRLATDHLHVIGDIYDRGMYPDRIMEQLIKYHSVDIQWGNHDILWMGAASGSEVCMMDAIRITARYGNLEFLEDAYGINLLPLATYGMHHYKEVEPFFYPKKGKFSADETRVIAQIHKAATILMLKLQGQIIDRNEDFKMENRKVLDFINYKKGTIILEGKEYEMKDCSFETIDPDNPYEITKEEWKLIEKVKKSFIHNTLLQRHVAFLFSKGSIYKVYNENLLYHGCIPLDEKGDYQVMSIKQKKYKGKELLEFFEGKVRKAYAKRHKDGENERDIFWYLWSGEKSSLFGKKEMKTFERYYVIDERTHVEKKNAYYQYIEQKDICVRILKDFGLKKKMSKIVNGHVPVKTKKGEHPVKAEGKLLVIDGGLSKAYQGQTGIAGYTLIYNSHGMLLAEHQPFTSAIDSYEHDIELVSKLFIVEENYQRLLVGDTDIGKKLHKEASDLKELLQAYVRGEIKESM